ncbi:MAG: hypothetical protein ACYDAO_00125 [Thermoplasmataceae archaeon]
MKKIGVEVVSLVRNFDVKDGKPSIVVSFGNIIESTPEVRERVAATGQEAQPDKTIANRAVLFVPDISETPYALGSKWTLKIEDNGSVSITKDK